MRRIAIALSATLGTTASLLAIGATAAQAAPATVYVSPSGHSGGHDSSCATAAYSGINAAIGAVGTGGKVVVCPGTYHTQAVVTKRLSLVGRAGAVINAKGQPPLKIGGMKLPGSIGVGVLETSHVTVTGLKVEGAGFDAVLVGLSSHVTVTHNLLVHNGDVGVDLNGTSRSTAAHNVSEHNAGGGFLVADDVGPSSRNVVAWNVASYNPGGCGVILAGHTTAGVSRTWVAHNKLTYNGTLKKSSGAGVVIASPVPGGKVFDNTVIHNVIYRNGLAGVTIHAHLPGQHLNGNRIIDNVIGTNNTVGDPIDLAPSPSSKKNLAKADKRWTGILVGSASHIFVVISGNHISRNHFGIFLEGVGHRVHASLRHNHFRHVTKRIKRVVV